MQIWGCELGPGGPVLGKVFQLFYLCLAMGVQRLSSNIVGECMPIILIKALSPCQKGPEDLREPGIQLQEQVGTQS